MELNNLTLKPDGIKDGPSLLFDNVYRTYEDDQNPEALFGKALRYLTSLRVNHTSEQQEIIHTEVMESLFHAIYGSNSIEKAGLGWDATRYLCYKTLHEPNSILEVNEDDSDFNEKVQDLYVADPTLREKSRSHVVRGRREVVQHVRAFEHMMDRFWVHGEDLTEDLIKKTHEILCKGVSIIDPGAEHPEVLYEKYAGQYRDVPVGAGNTMFVMPQYVPAKMAEMCASIKNDIDGKKRLDPFSIAAKYSLRFVEIHPFQDGNGRMCRIILSAILFRYVGIFISIRETQDDINEYINIKKRASRDMEGHGEYATFVLKKSVKSIQKLKQRVNGKKAA
ncbi:fic doc family [Fusarium subglutinans]|uniref:Fic doc family n=1 Tax=Gibberella subglutinans TaxID=42677 RepID=A0A8H5QFH9_GIBSU|nr:fic doc family [Fusarium subglutinans]KAF5613814.1 fic doc family [Fusarium subglutinans]